MIALVLLLFFLFSLLQYIEYNNTWTSYILTLQAPLWVGCYCLGFLLGCSRLLLISSPKVDIWLCLYHLDCLCEYHKLRMRLNLWSASQMVFCCFHFRTFCFQLMTKLTSSSHSQGVGGTCHRCSHEWRQIKTDILRGTWGSSTSIWKDCTHSWTWLANVRRSRWTSCREFPTLDSLHPLPVWWRVVVASRCRRCPRLSASFWLSGDTGGKDDLWTWKTEIA